MLSQKIHWFIVAYKVGDGSSHRQIATFKDESVHNQFVKDHLAKQIKEGDWYDLDEKKFNETYKEAKEKKYEGLVFNLADV